MNGRRSKSQLTVFCSTIPLPLHPGVKDMWSVWPDIGSPAMEDGGYRQRGDQKLQTAHVGFR